MGFPFYFLPDATTPATPVAGNSLVLKGFGGPLWLTRGLGAGAKPLPADLPNALAAAVRATSTIASIAGGFTNIRLPQRAVYPAVVGTIRTGRTESRSSSYDRVLVPICLRVYSEDADEAKALSKALDAEIAGVCLDFTGAMATKLLRDGEPASGWIAARTPTGKAEFTERKYLCRIRRARVLVKL